MLQLFEINENNQSRNQNLLPTLKGVQLREFANLNLLTIASLKVFQIAMLKTSFRAEGLPKGIALQTPKGP